MLGIHPLDILVIVLYFTIISLIGWWSSKRIKDTGDFFVAGRKFGKFLTAMLSFGTGTHADQAVGVVSMSYRVGLSGIWYEWMWLLVNPFYWIMAPILRRLRVVNGADYFAKRYNQSFASLYAFVAVIILMLNIGTMVLGSSRIIEGLTGGGVNFYSGVIIITVLFVFYGLAGGMVAAALNDVIQGILTIVFSFLMIPFAVSAVGGFPALHEKVSANATYDMFSLVAPKGITFFWIAMVVINGAINWAVQPHTIPSSTANRTEMDARVGVTYGNFIKRFCTIAWAFTGIAAIPLLPNLKNPDSAFGEMAALLLPVGLVGLLISSLLATIQSTGVVLMLSGSSIFVRNFYAVYFRKKSESHYLFAGRVVAFLIVIGSLAFALLLPGVVKALELFMQIPALIGIAFWMGIVWRRANPASAWASFLAAAGVFLYCELALELPLPWQMVCYLTAGIVTGIVVGLITKPQRKERLDRFYANLKTPVDKEEHLASDTVA
jgi:Na+/proline symporter